MTCREAVLHVGMHKTGSSSIQDSLHEYDNGSIRYARLGAANQSNTFINVFSKSPETYTTNINLGYSLEEVKGKRERLNKKLQSECKLDRDVLIFSGEDISLLQVDEVEAIANFFFSRNISVRIIAYIRDPISFASSAFSEIVRGGHLGNTIPMPAYRFRFQKFYDFFGEGSVHLIPFDNRQFQNRSVVQDFCNRLGIDHTEIKELTTNKRSSKSVTQLLYLLNNSSSITLGCGRLLKSRQKLVELLESNFGDAPLSLPTEILNLSEIKDDLEWMTEKLPDWTPINEIVPNPISRELQLNSVKEYMLTLEPGVLPALQDLVASSDSLIAKSENTVGLISYLFHEIHFRKNPLTKRMRAAIRKFPKNMTAKIQHYLSESNSTN